MRNLMLILAMTAGLLLSPAIVPAGSSLPVAVSAATAGDAAALQEAPQPPQINVEVDRDGRAWYASPVWIAIGVLALVVLVMVIVGASRGGGTTVVKG